MNTEKQAAPICCDLCDAAVPDVESAIAADWSAAYFIGDDQQGHVCGKCAIEKCEVSKEDGELVLKNSSKIKRLQSAIGHLESAAEILRQLGGVDCDYAGVVIAATISTDGGAAGLKSLLKIWQRGG